MARFNYYRPSNGVYGHENGAYLDSAPVRIIDDFEDNDVSEYNIPGGDFYTDTQYAYSGSYCGESTGYGNRISTSGLANYPGPGDTFVAHVNQHTNPDNNPGVCFGAQDKDNCYALSLHASGELRFYRWDAGSRTTVKKTAMTVTDTNWYRLKIDWASDNTFTCTAYDASSDTKEASFTVTDTTFTATGFGWHPGNWGGDTNPIMSFDYAKII